jgi:hypothetical protein
MFFSHDYNRSMGLGEECQKVEVSFLSCNASDDTCQCDLLLTMLTMITWPTQDLSGFPMILFSLSTLFFWNQ